MRRDILFQPLQDNELLNFLHIPKTAGISFNSLIVEMFPEDEVFVGDVGPILVAMSNGKKYDVTPFKYLRAHLGYVENLFTKPIRYITFLRDPVDRVISAYKHLLRTPKERMYTTIQFFDSFAQLMGNAKSFPFRNQQTRMISGYFQLENNAFISYSGNQPYQDPLFLEAALKNLDSLAFFGIANRFAESIELLEHILGWNLPQLPKRKNIAPNTQEVEFSQKDIELIRKYNQLDIALYEEAVKLFDECIKKMKSEKAALIEKNKGVIELRGPIKEIIKPISYKQRGNCPVCEKETTFASDHPDLGQNYVCENCGSLPGTRAVVRYLDEQVPGWRKNRRIHEYNPYLRSLMANSEYYSCSLQFPGRPNKSEIDGIRNENPALLSFPDNSFHIFISNNLLDCILYPEQSIMQMVRVVKPGGMIIIVVPMEKIPNESGDFRHRATEISGEFQPLHRPIYRKTAVGQKLLVGIDLSTHVESLFTRWSKQPTSLVAMKERETGIEGNTTTLVVIKKMVGSALPVQLENVLEARWKAINNYQIAKNEKLKIYVNTEELQIKAINSLDVTIAELHTEIEGLRKKNRK